MLCFGALGSSGQRSSVEIHCLEHNLTRMLADGLMLNIACALFFVHKIKSYHTGLSGSPGYPSSQSTYVLCSPQVWVQGSSLKVETFLRNRSFSPQRKTASASRVDRNRMGRAASLYGPSLLHSIQKALLRSKQQKERKLICKVIIVVGPQLNGLASFPVGRWKYRSVDLHSSHLKKKIEQLVFVNVKYVIQWPQKCILNTPSLAVCF